MPWSVLNSTATAQRRASSSQQFYTRTAIIDHCVKAIVRSPQTAPQPHETIIDFACGDNQFGVRLRGAADVDASITLRSFDVAPPARGLQAPETVVVRDFLSTTPQDFSDVAGNCVLGFNPPFGFRSSRLQQFVKHAIDVARPRCIYLIHQRRLYRPGGYSTHYQRALPLRSFHVPSDDDKKERVFPMYGCFFTIFTRCEQGNERPAHSGIREVTDGLPPWIESFTHMRGVCTGDTLALLRTGSRAGTVCALLDAVAARVVAIYDRGIRVTALPTATPLDSNIYYKLRIAPERLVAYAPVTVDQLARLLSLQGASDRSKNNSFPPYITRTHVIRCLEHTFVKGSAVGSSKKRRRDPFDGDIRDYLNA